MICNPNDNTLNPGVIGPPPIIPGLGLPFSFPKIPFPDLAIPEGIPEDIINLVKNLLAAIPGGPLIPNPDNFMKDVWDALASLLNQLGPYLALYNFFQALLNMILCIIDVICSLMNPFKLRKAVKRLFKRCLPDFLALFPWLALLAMILALLLLLLALIEYLIALIKKYIEDIIANLTILYKALQFNDAQSTIDGAMKISYLLCLIEQLFAILIAFQTILNIIQSLADIVGRSVCSGGLHPDDCCTDEVCPPFIRNNENGIPGTLGVLYYLKERYDPTSTLTLRPQKWQFYDAEAGRTYNFKDIITPIDGEIFWPEPYEFAGKTNIKNAPYLVDMTVTLDPTVFSHVDTLGTRQFQIKDIIVSVEPYYGIEASDNSINNSINATGTLKLLGGKVYEADGITPYMIGSDQATIETFITEAKAQNMPPPGTDDGFWITNISYTFKINYEALIRYMVINVMCAPDVSIESAVVNATMNTDSVIAKIGALPDVGGTVVCLTTALAKFRRNVSAETAAIFEAEVNTCLNGLKTQAEDSYVKAITAGMSAYNSTVTLDPDLQFVSAPIIITVKLVDPHGVVISNKVPPSLAAQISAKITATPTLGYVNAFTHDGYDAFIADLRSNIPGHGTLTVQFDSQILSEIINRDDDNVATVIQPIVLPYEFVGMPYVASEQEQVRRDAGDTARDGG